MVDFSFFWKIINGFHFLLGISSISFFLKFYLFILAFLQGMRSAKKSWPWFFLLLILAGAMLSDLAWIFSSGRIILSIQDALSYALVVFIIRFSWAWHIIQYQALALFVESLIEHKYQLRFLQKILIGISSSMCLMLCYYAFFEFNTSYERSSYEFALITAASVYVFIIILPSLYYGIKKIRSPQIPKILKKQLNILFRAFIGPSLIFDFLQVYPFSFYTGFTANNYAIVSVSTIFLTIALYFSAKKVIGLRFLNMQEHVQEIGSFNFIDNFREVLEKLAQVTNSKELHHITQAFFKESFEMPPNRVNLYIRNFENKKVISQNTSIIETYVEDFLSAQATQSDIASFLQQTKVLITDELKFSNFYQESAVSAKIITFMDRINADIFIPMYNKNIVIGYIVVDQGARPAAFYSKAERDQMLVFATYTSNIIHLLQNHSIEVLLEKERELQEELYLKHQEINQYKESIRSFMRDANQRKIGIIFYKNRRFVMGNQAAEELIDINLNTQVGHPLSKALYSLVHKVQEFKNAQSSLVKDGKNNNLVLSAIPQSDHNTIIVLVYYPEISDILKNQIDLLKNPSEWDYLLYLETTQSGQLVNQLIPSAGEIFLNFKLDLLKLALHKKAILLDMPEEDLLATVEIIHHISLREHLHAIHLKNIEKSFETAIKLFGLNPIFGGQQESALLEKLHNTGTLFIQNIHLLHLETQQALAQFLRYGYFTIFKSSQKVWANVRIICSSNQNLSKLVQDGLFSKDLFEQLKQASLVMPSLSALSQGELNVLVDGLMNQALKTTTFNNLLSLTEKDKGKLSAARPVSLYELKKQIQNLLVQKSKKSEIFHETLFDPAYTISNPELAHAARLGKKALKDPKVMGLLWHTFKNQNKIAHFLGVNRSSVNRRCKEYNLL